MRIFNGGVAHLSSAIEGDLLNRNINLNKPHIEGLADLAASVLSVRSVNSAEWISVMPRQCNKKSRERYIYLVFWPIP
jgi:hypothetical protein